MVKIGQFKVLTDNSKDKEQINQAIAEHLD